MDENKWQEDKDTKRLLEYYKQLRKKTKMSQTALENITGIGRTTMNRYEQGTQVPTVRTLSRLLEPMGYRLEIVPIPGTEDKKELQTEALKEEENEK